MDCIEGMKKIESNSVDSIVTDPPYGLAFMGKDWDSFTPKEYQQFSYEWSKEALRILKPGGHLLSFGGSRTYHRMACAIEDAGFQIRDTIMWVYGCLDEQTEILTEDGWKKYNEISITNKVFSFVNKKIIKNSVKNIFNYQVKNEEMVYIKNHNTNQLLTKNHKMLIQENNRKQINNIRDSWYDENFRYVDAWDRPQKYKIPLSGIYDGKYSIGKDFAEVIGWIISEGHFQKDCNAVNIYQSSVNKEKVERIKYVLGRCGIIYSEYKREREYKDRKYVEHQFYISGEWSKKIKDIIPNKKINKKLLELSHGEKERLIVGLCEGDGSKNRNGGYGAFYQSDLEQLELFQILLHLTNKQGWINKNKMCCSIHYNPTTEIQGKHKKQSKIYTGIVWCIETEIGNFMARRNGKIFITGNSGFPKSLNIGKAVDKLQGNEREKIGEKPTLHHGTKDNVQKYGFATDGNIEITKGTSEWEGWGTALKPAHEPIVLARKPLSEKTVAENCLKWGVGGLNIDGCRVEAKDQDILDAAVKRMTGNKAVGWKNTSSNGIQPISKQGRFPANFIHDGSQEVLDLFPETKSIRSKRGGNVNSGSERYQWNKGDKEEFNKEDAYECGFDDSGSASRFFYCVKAHSSERNAGLDNCGGGGITSPIDDDGKIIVSGDKGCAGKYGSAKAIAKNDIATLKPINLMRYLVRLVTPLKGIVVDPFAGSGTTGIACVIEGFNYILFEKRERFAKEIIPRRINYWSKSKNWKELNEHKELPKPSKATLDRWL